jgi:hypothetical protein
MFAVCQFTLLLHIVEPYKYQLRAYIYQARDLLAGDKTGLSGEPAVILSLFRASFSDVDVCGCHNF